MGPLRRYLQPQFDTSSSPALSFNPPPPHFWCDPGYMVIAGCTSFLLPGGSMDAACIAWETALPFPSRPFVSLLLPPRPTHPTPLSPPAHSSGVCLFLPVAVLLQLSPLLWFCFGACCAWGCLLFCVPGLGSCVLSPPAFPPFLSLFCLLVVCSLCLFSAFVVLSFVSPLFVVAGCPCSLPSFPLPPLVCVSILADFFTTDLF